MWVRTKSRCHSGELDDRPASVLLKSMPDHSLRLVAQGVTMLLGVSVSYGSPFVDRDDWRTRDRVLGGYTFEWEVETHDVYIATKKFPARTSKIGGSPLILPAMDEGWDFKKKVSFVASRRNGRTAIRGEVVSYDASRHRPDHLTVRNFFGPDWVGGVTQVPVNGNLKAATFEVYRSSPPTVACQAPEAFHLAGSNAPFLYGTNPFDLYRLDWQTREEGDGAEIIASNHTRTAITNRMASNVPIELTCRFDGDGRLLEIAEWPNPQTNPAHIPFGTVKALAWRRVADYLVPSDVVIHRNKDISGRIPTGYTDHRCRLLKVYPTKEDVKPPVPLGIHVADWRLQQTEYQPGNLPTGKEEPVFYPWNGKLPTMDELRALHDK